MAYTSLAPNAAAYDRSALSPRAEGETPTSFALLADKSIPASAKAVLRVLLHLEGGTLRMRLPDGRLLLFGDGNGPAFDITIHNYRFARRVMFNGDSGFGEGWMEGDWDSPDLIGLLAFLCGNGHQIGRYIHGGPIAASLSRLLHLTRANTRKGARRNILAHYDLGNSFYEAWLDPSMTYSSALFGDSAISVEAAQRAKYHAMAKLIDLKPGDHVLEIGCGWGGFAEVAAMDFGARVTGITISDAQLAYAQARMKRLDLTDRVEIRRQDYRDLTGQFDAIVSIEMLEAVGERYWPTYFSKVAETLKPGGAAALQVITMRDDLFDAYRRRADFIQHYIFPGGMLPTEQSMQREAHQAGLKWQTTDRFAADYEKTLLAWAHRFQDNWPSIKALGFDERFHRLWLYYLAYCAAGFHNSQTNLVQFALRKPL